VSNPVQERGSDVLDSQDQVRFEMLVLPHLDAAFNLARSFLRSGADAEDIAQEALLRSYRFFHGFHGGDVRAWLLQIVRNTCYTWLEKSRHAKDMTEFDEELLGPSSPTPEAPAIAGDNRRAAHPCSQVFAATLSGSNRAPRAGRVFVQGDCHHYFDSHRYGHVHAFTCPPAASTGPC
jgi:RNA polymerase sigma factor (sigma-70 family)